MTYGNYPDLKNVKKILVIKLRHHGDVLLTSPVFSHLKKAMPDAQIDAFLYKDTLPMLEGHPDIFQFFLYDRNWKKGSLFSRIKKEISLLLQIRKERYDLVINLTEGDRGAIAALVSGSRYKIGFDRGGKRVLGRKKLYTHNVKHCPTPRHTVEKQLDVLRCMGLFPKKEERDLVFHIPQNAYQSVREMLNKVSLEEKEYIVIHPVSRWMFKCLPANAIGALIHELVLKGKSVVLTSGPDKQERAMIEDVLSHSPKENVIDLGGKTSLKELGALISLSEMLICVDSVPLHMASALKTPVVALFGPTSEINWGPWMHPKAIIVAQKMSCRPCFKDGCAGSKMSDCLHTMPLSSILSAVDKLKCEDPLAILI